MEINRNGCLTLADAATKYARCIASLLIFKQIILFHFRKHSY